MVSSQDCSFACSAGIDTVFSLHEIASYCKAIYTDSPPHSMHRKFCKLHKTVSLILNIDVINSLKWIYFTGEFRMYFVQEKYEECKDSFCTFTVLLIQAQNCFVFLVTREICYFWCESEIFSIFTLPYMFASLRVAHCHSLSL